MLTDPPQRIVSVSCRGITHNTLDLTWSEPLRSYDEEVFVGYLVRGCRRLFFRCTFAGFRGMFKGFMSEFFSLRGICAYA